MSDKNQEQTPLEQKQEQQKKSSPLEQVRALQEENQQALQAKEQEAENHRPPPEHNPAGNRKENPQRQLG